MCDSGAIAAQRANQRVSEAIERDEAYLESTLCMDCEYCEHESADTPGPYEYGWCRKNEFLLDDRSLHETLKFMGCFE